MNQVFTAAIKGAFNRQRLLLINGFLCVIYPVIYTFLILVPPVAESSNNVNTTAVVTVNLIFLAVIILNLNTIRSVYHLAGTLPSKLYRVIYYICFGAWLIYALVAFSFTLFVPGFITHFFHHVQHRFRPLSLQMLIPCTFFFIGMSCMVWRYYSKAGLREFAFFMVVVLALFSYKYMLPYLFNIMAWVFFSGFHFCIYLVVDESRKMKASISTWKEDTVATGSLTLGMQMEQDLVNH